MELFPNEGFVRLQSRANSKYVHADGDWTGVSLSPLGVGTVSPLESVWRVEHIPVNNQGDGDGDGGVGVFVLLQNAAYGRYLTFSPDDSQPGHRGRRAVQADRNEPPEHVLNAYRWWWRVERVDPNHDFVRLRYADSHSFLRANGRYRTSNTGVTVDRNRRRGLTTMMQWTVHDVQATAVPVPLPVAPAPPPQPSQIQGRRRGLLFFWRRTGNRNPRVQMHPDPGRTIRHVQASDEGDFDPNHFNWPSLTSYDNSVINLRTQLGQLHQNQNQNQNQNENANGFTLCIRAGVHARLMPLVTHLPHSLDDMDIVVLRTGSAAAAALMYPQIAEAAQ